MRRLREHGPALAILVVLGGLSWLIVYVSGGASVVPPHFPYIPIFFAGQRFGVRGAVATAVVLGVANGPLLPADVSAGTAQPVSDWAVRLAFFVAIGACMAIVLRRSRVHEEQVVQEARAEQKTSLLDAVFLQTAAHEIRTPLTVISGIARTLERPGMVAELGAPLLQSLSRAVDRLDRLSTISLASVGVLDEVSRAVSDVDLRELVTSIGDDLGELNGPRRLTVHVAGDATVIRTQTKLLRFALSALVENALRSSSRSSAVDVWIDVEVDRARIAVRSVGDGFGKAVLDGMKEAWVEPDPAGIELLAVRRLVEQLGGRLTLSNPAGGGGEAVVLLPVQEKRVRLPDDA